MAAGWDSARGGGWLTVAQPMLRVAEQTPADQQTQANDDA
jgi:hypothetical protein